MQGTSMVGLGPASLLPSIYRCLQSLVGFQTRAGEIELAHTPGNHWALDECGHVDKHASLLKGPHALPPH